MYRDMNIGELKQERKRLIKMMNDIYDEGGDGGDFEHDIQEIDELLQDVSKVQSIKNGKFMI